MEKKSEKISEMAAVLWQAANMEERTDDARDVIARLQRENHAMRELLQLELLDSAEVSSETETRKPASSDAAIQTHPSPDDDPFCTGDFATIRPRPPSCGTPTAGKSHSGSSENARNSPRPQNRDDEDGCSQLLPSENSTDASSNILESSSDACLTGAVAEVDCVPADDIGHVNCSESLETLVNPNDLSADDECL